MSFKIRKSVWCEDFPDMREFTAITNDVAADTMVIWAAAGVNGTTGAAAVRDTIAGIAQSAATVSPATKALVTPLVSGMIIETQYQTGTPAVGDAVSTYSSTQVNKTVTTDPVIGRVVEVINAATSAATINGVSVPARTVLVQII